MKRGLYRIHGVGGLPDDVRVEDDGIEMPLEEGLYRARGHLPLVDDLPWKEEYLAEKQAVDDASSANAGADKASRAQSRQDFLRRFGKS